MKHFLKALKMFIFDEEVKFPEIPKMPSKRELLGEENIKTLQAQKYRQKLAEEERGTDCPVCGEYEYCSDSCRSQTLLLMEKEEK